MQLERFDYKKVSDGWPLRIDFDPDTFEHAVRFTGELVSGADFKDDDQAASGLLAEVLMFIAIHKIPGVAEAMNVEYSIPVCGGLLDTKRKLDRLVKERTRSFLIADDIKRGAQTVSFKNGVEECAEKTYGIFNDMRYVLFSPELEKGCGGCPKTITHCVLIGKTLYVNGVIYNRWLFEGRCLSDTAKGIVARGSRKQCRFMSAKQHMCTSSLGAYGYGIEMFERYCNGVDPGAPIVSQEYFKDNLLQYVNMKFYPEFDVPFPFPELLPSISDTER